jgi:hypothetical protein
MSTQPARQQPQAPRRRRGPRRGPPRDQLTGGTGDVNPQPLVAACTQSSADTTTTATTVLPNLIAAGAAPRIVELLKATFVFPNTIVEVDGSISASLSTSSFGTTSASPGDPRVLAFANRAYAITTSGSVVNNNAVEYDLSDGAGHGVLVGGQNLFLQVASSGTSAANTVYCRLLYRWKGVTMVEYVGIVQSQY